ncbi:2-dehydro-3-deoxy-6-phosphogalactonate aldolase [Sphingopyxis sp.]|uniref:2-dehydro-3-deoxy-6-phosphogalactonate aldolase n=1 Tax=Sphingopyxis sp. TaxID=1908224 RepID=UPI0039C9245A
MEWSDFLAGVPLVAILRGLTPEAAEPVGEVLVAAGFRCLEVPLNSPRPFESIKILSARFGDTAIVGAGTVLSPAEVDAVAGAGGRIVISPDTNPEVIRATKAAGLLSLPGFFSPSEAFAALRAGADGLKLFPADAGGLATLKALKAVLPPAAPVMPVGGVDADTMAAFRAAGAGGFGIGSWLYTPGRDVAVISERAVQLVAGWMTGNKQAATPGQGMADGE